MTGWRKRIARGAPRILLLGPAGAGKTTLVRAAMRAASPAAARPAGADGGRADWSDVGGGVIIDVPGVIAFPPAGLNLIAWEHLLRHLRRLRPRRPLDAVILALPAPLLIEPGREDERLHLSAAIRERFALLQGLLGFTLPVYVVITKADEIPGFDTFTSTLTDEQLRNMFGWSNPHGIDEPFSPTWVNEGIESLHDAVVCARVARFASSTHLRDRGDLFLFTRTLRHMAAPLRTLLGDLFRPSLYREAVSCRGFYLCGRVSDDSRSIAFLDDLLAGKVFAERGVARPVHDIAEARRRSALVAQIVSALLVLALGFGMYWTYNRLRRGQEEFLALLGRAEAIVAERRQAVSNGRPLTASYRLHQTRGLLDGQLQAINSDAFSWVVYRLNPSLRDTLTRIFRDIVLDDFRVALEDKGRRWLHATQVPANDPAPSGPDFQDRPRYRALARFAQAYSPFVDSYRRYDDLRRPDGTGTVASLAAISEYVDGTPLEVHALGRPYARALRNADAAPIDCRIFRDRTSGESLVAIQAAALLDEFRDWTFDEHNPVRSAARDFTDDWELVSSGSGEPPDLESLILDTAALSEAVTAWATLDTAIANQPLALFQQAPFTPRPADPALCRDLLWPDLGDQLQNVERVKDSLRDQLLAIEVEPFGPLFTDDDGLALSEPVAALKKDLDTLQAQSFWASPSDGFEEESAAWTLPRFTTWRTEDLDAAVKTADGFESYRGAAFNTVEYASRGALLDVVEAEVADVVATRLRRTAVAGSELPLDSAARLEQLKVTGSVVAKLAPIAPLLRRSQSGAIVLSALDSQAAAALAAVDREASREYPWLFSWPRRPGTLDALFSRWETIRRSAPAADAPKLWEAAADDQRDAAVKFAAVANPFATYLIARRGLSEPALRWGRIGRDVASYEQKLPDNGLGVLDAFVRKGVPAMLPANACGGGTTATARAAGEYFPLLRDQLAREGERQCRIQIQRDYATVVDVFNAQLRDRFPFIERSSPAFADSVRTVQGRAEATPDGVKALLDVYRSVDGPAVTRFLESRGTCSGDQALTFLQGVDTASTLLASAADPALKTPTIVLDVNPEFRLAANPGAGGDHIAEWRIDVGARSVREPLPAPSTPLPWTYGDPVSLIIRFARDSPSVPAPGAGVRLRDANADDRTVRFDFTGNWAIFQLLLARTISREADALLVRDIAPTVLAFDIPVRPDPAKPPLAKTGPVSSFELYMRLGIFPRGKTEVLSVGRLPTRAPATVACLGM
jgi:type VI secretion system protein ImpL